MTLTKHHGLGNDFLVLLDDDGSRPIDGVIARALCDRRAGVGADGLIRATRPNGGAGGPVATMDLRNADGSPAEMSGNGIRCLAHALLLAGWAEGPSIPVETRAGVRTVTVHDGSGPLTASLSVDMGAARIEGDAPEWTGGTIGAALRVDVGNPHLVLRLDADEADAADDVDLAELGEQINAKEVGGTNVHLLAAASPGRIAIRTYERGVGLTPACGSGACAAAVAARQWGLGADVLTVDQAGGAVEVSVGDDGAVVLGGPATFVATVELPGEWPWR